MIGLVAKLTGPLNGQVVGLVEPTTPKKHAVTGKMEALKKMNHSI